MSHLTQIEREARLTRDLITELKGYTPKFNAAKERAEEELKIHLAKIDAERAHLVTLIDAAAIIVQHLGTNVPVMVEAEVAEPEIAEPPHTEAEVAAVMAADAVQAEEPEPVVAMIDSPQAEEADAPQVFVSGDHAESLYPETLNATFETIGQVAAEITAAVEQMAGEQPSTPDATDEPELTDTQVERVEIELASGEPVRASYRFTPFAANPFA